LKFLGWWFLIATSYLALFPRIGGGAVLVDASVAVVAVLSDFAAVFAFAVHTVPSFSGTCPKIECSTPGLPGVVFIQSFM